MPYFLVLVSHVRTSLVLMLVLIAQVGTRLNTVLSLCLVLVGSSHEHHFLSNCVRGLYCFPFLYYFVVFVLHQGKAEKYVTS